jgi:hypothetical protein
MSRETLGAWTRRVAGWTWKASIAVLAFVVVFRVVRFLDSGTPSAPRPAGPVQTQLRLLWDQVVFLLIADVFFGWVKRHLPTHRPRYALLDLFAQAPVDSPEFKAAALDHFRRRSRVLALAAVSIGLFALLDLVGSFQEPRARIPVSVLGALCVFLYGALKLKGEMGPLRAVAGAASGDDATRAAVVRSLAQEGAGGWTDEVSRAIWRRFEREAPAPLPAGSAAAPA